MKIMRLLLFSLFLFSSCGDPAGPSGEDIKNEFAVNFIINTLSHWQNGLLTRVVNADSNPIKYAWGRVYLNDRPCSSVSRTDDYFEYPSLNALHNYEIENFASHPGDTITLRIETEDKIISGKTVTPEFVTGVTVNFENRVLELSWGTIAPLFQVQLYYKHTIDDSSKDWKWSTYTTLLTNTNRLRINFQPDEELASEYLAVFYAIDQNYADYLNNKTISAGLSGAYGVFGAVSKSQKIIKTPAEESGSNKQ